MQRELEALQDLNARARRGGMSRREFTTLVAGLVASAPMLRATQAYAQAKQLVLVCFGGDAIPAYDEAYGQPFAEATGIDVKIDGSGALEGAIAAQFKSGKPTWDILDLDPFSSITLGKQGMLEPIDYSVVDRSKFRPGFGWEYAASTYFFSFVIAYDSSRYETAPTGMADFFDVEKFPGKRSLHRWGSAMWEAALLADGVPPDQLYPLDLKRAHDKIAAFKDNVVSYWSSGSDAQSILLNGEASMAIIWHTRASLIEQDSGGQIKFIWDQGIISPGALGVMKGNPGGREAAMQFIASTQDPEKQLVMFREIRQGPANPATDALIPEDERRFNCVDPANMAKQVAMNMEWYADNYTQALDQYTQIISA